MGCEDVNLARYGRVACPGARYHVRMERMLIKRQFDKVNARGFLSKSLASDNASPPRVDLAVVAARCKPLSMKG